MPAIGVIPIPALASTRGRSVYSITTSPKGAERTTSSPTWTSLCSRLDISPSGVPRPWTRFTANWRCCPSSAFVRLYCLGWCTPSCMRHLDRDVLPRQGRLDLALIHPLDHEPDDVVRLLDPLGHPPGPPDRVRGEVHRVVQPAFLVDEHVRHQPVDLVPGRGDLGRDGVPQHVHDGPHQVVVDDLVLVRAQPQRDVLVGDPRQEVVRDLVHVVHEQPGERRNGPGEGLLLAAVRLVPPVEEPVQEVRPRLEHVFVEALGDLLDVLADDGQRCLDDGK